MSKIKHTRLALDLIENLITLGDAITVDHRNNQLQRAADSLRQVLGTAIVLHPEIDHDPFNEWCRCDVCNFRRPMTQADVDLAQAKIAEQNGGELGAVHIWSVASSRPLITEQAGV